MDEPAATVVAAVVGGGEEEGMLAEKKAAGGLETATPGTSDGAVILAPVSPVDVSNE